MQCICQGARQGALKEFCGLWSAVLSAISKQFGSPGTMHKSTSMCYQCMGHHGASTSNQMLQLSLRCISLQSRGGHTGRVNFNFDARQKYLPLFSIRVATQEAFLKHLFFRTSQQTFFNARQFLTRIKNKRVCVAAASLPLQSTNSLCDTAVHRPLPTPRHCEDGAAARDRTPLRGSPIMCPIQSVLRQSRRVGINTSRRLGLS